MILIDAVYINKSGGKILLDYLIEQLQLTDLEVFYLLDTRVRNNHPLIKPGNTVLFLDGSLIDRYRFYKEHAHRFSKILCFGNIPPGKKVKATVFTYFHQLLFIKAPRELTLYSRFLILLKTAVLQYTARNSDFWLVQSAEVKEGLIKKYNGIKEEQIKVLPFYPPLKLEKSVERKKNRFVYVSTGPPHKNHERLLQAFIVFFDKHKLGELHLTIHSEFETLSRRIAVLQSSGYPIVNHGFVERARLAEIYQSSEFAIYPSLAESFGLGIIEGIENGCKIVASDMPWLHAVCKPTFVFNPQSVQSITEAIEKVAFEDVTPSEQLVFNEIEHIIGFLR